MLNGEGVRLVPACREARNGISARPGPPTCAAPFHVMLGRRLRRLRVERGLSRKVVAASLGCSVRRIEGHERGTREIEARDLVGYVSLYRIRISDLFSDDLPTGGNGEY